MKQIFIPVSLPTEEETFELVVTVGRTTLRDE
jgi:hypothetical protein